MSDESRPGSDDDARYSNESGYSTGFTTGEDSDDIFGDEFDAMSVLRTMEEQEGGDPAGVQPYQVLTRRGTRATRQVRQNEDMPSASAHDTFGADMDEMLDPNLAEELGLSGGRRKRRSRRRKSKKRREIPEHVVKMLGEANVLYATEGYEKAHTLLLEIVRIAPNWADPWYTLGLLYEAVGDPKKALNVYMIAAHLTKKDAGFWKRLAQMSVALGFFHQAIYCLTKALNRDKGDVDVRFDRAVLYAELDQTKRAIVELEQVWKDEPDHPQVPVSLARLYHRLKQPDKAIQLLENYLKGMESMDRTHVNILAELYMEQGSYHDTITLIHKAQEQAPAEDPLPPDLMIKAGLCHLQLGNVEAANEQLFPLLQEAVEHFSDLFLEAGNAYMNAGQHTLALEFLERLLGCADFNNPGLWSRICKCYRAIDALYKGIALYEAQLQHIAPDNPHYIEVTLSLAELLADTKQTERVRELLRQTDALIDSGQAALPEDAEERAATLSRRQSLFLNLGDTSMFIESLLPTITDTLAAMEASQHATNLKNLPPELRRAVQKRERQLAAGKRQTGTDTENDEIFKAGQSRDRRKKHVRALDAQADEFLATQAESDAGGGEPSSLFSNPQTFNLFLQCCSAMVDSGRHAEAKQLLQRGMRACKGGKGKANMRQYRLQIRMVLARALAASNELNAAVICLTQVIARDADNREAWNLFCRLFNKGGSMRQWTRFVQSMRTRNPSCLCPAIMQGHSYMLKRQYQQALAEYFAALSASPKEPLLLLCCGVAYHGMATSRATPDRHRAVLTGFAFFQEYSRARDLTQEGLYNMARAAHGLGLLYIAEDLYKKALAATPAQAPVAKPNEAPLPASSLDLQREAAFNLSMIYRSSGADELAREVLRKHFTV